MDFTRQDSLSVLSSGVPSLDRTDGEARTRPGTCRGVQGWGVVVGDVDGLSSVP